MGLNELFAKGNEYAKQLCVPTKGGYFYAAIKI